MDETDGATTRINHENRATIRDVDSQADSALVGNDAVAVRETFVGRERDINDGNFVPVDLLGRDERHRGDPLPSANLSMDVVQPRERLRFVVRHLDARHPQGETVNNLRQRAERGEMFDRKRSFAHLLPVVRLVRVVVVVV